MQIEIQIQDLEFTDELRRLIERRLRYVLRSVQLEVCKVVVFLSNENRWEGSKDKYCRIQIEARSLPCSDRRAPFQRYIFST